MPGWAEGRAFWSMPSEIVEEYGQLLLAVNAESLGWGFRSSESSQGWCGWGVSLIPRPWCLYGGQPRF